MGKAVPKGIKSKALLLMKELPEKFKPDFEHNKAALLELEIPMSKTNRNILAGFIARKLKQQELKEKAIKKAIAEKKTEQPAKEGQ